MSRRLLLTRVWLPRPSVILAAILLSACASSDPMPVPPTATPPPIATPPQTATARPEDPTATTIPSPTQPPAPLTPIGAAVPSERRLTIGLSGSVWANHVGVLLASERGYYAAEGLDLFLHMSESPESVVTALVEGRDDLAILPALAVPLARAAGADVISILPINSRPVSSIIARADEATRPTQLGGSRVDLPPDAASLAVLTAVLRGAGLNTSDVTVIRGFDHAIERLAAGSTDALVGAMEREGAKLAVNGVRVTSYPLRCGSTECYGQVIATTARARDTHRDQIAAFARATTRAYTEAAQDPASALDLLERASGGESRSALEPGLVALAPEWKQPGAFGRQDERRWMAAVALLAELGMIPAGMDARALFSDEFVASTPTPAPPKAPSVTPSASISTGAPSTPTAAPGR